MFETGEPNVFKSLNLQASRRWLLQGLESKHACNEPSASTPPHGRTLVRSNSFVASKAGMQDVNAGSCTVKVCRTLPESSQAPTLDGLLLLGLCRLRLCGETATRVSPLFAYPAPSLQIRTNQTQFLEPWSSFVMVASWLVVICHERAKPTTQSDMLAR